MKRGLKADDNSMLHTFEVQTMMSSWIKNNADIIFSIDCYRPFFDLIVLMRLYTLGINRLHTLISFIVCLPHLGYLCLQSYCYGQHSKVNIALLLAESAVRCSVKTVRNERK